MESIDDRDPLLPPHAASPQWLRRLLLVLVLSIPVWGYGVFWDLSVARYYGALGHSLPGESPQSPPAYVLQHAILLPLLALAYYLAAGIFKQGGRRRWLIAKQAVLLLAFVSLVRPDLLVAQWLVGGEGSAGSLVAQLNQRHAWFHTAVSYSLIYFAGLCIVFGSLMVPKYREQQRAAALGARAEVASGGTAGRLMIKVGRAVRFIDMAAIESIEADGDYLNIHGASGERSRTRRSLASIEALLPSRQFARIHRSTLVNLDRVKEVRSDKHGGYILGMNSGRLLVTGARYAANIQRLVRP